MTSFEKFGDEFQLKLLHHIISDEKFAVQIIDILDPNFFSKDSFRDISQRIINWNSDYNTFPTTENLRTIFNIEYEDDDVKREFILTILDDIDNQVTIIDKEFIEDKTLEFCKQQAWKNAILESVELLKVDQFDKIPKVIEKAQAAGTAKDVGHDYEGDVERRTLKNRHPVATGWDLIDNCLAGGLGVGELGLVMAGTNVGKSMALAYLAGEAYMQGKNVAIVTLEMNEILYCLRIDAKVTKIPLTTLMVDSDGRYRPRVKQAIEKITEKYNRRPRLFTKEYPTKTASVSTIRNWLVTLRHKDFKPDVLLIDYSDLLKPMSGYSDKRFELESNVEQLRALAAQLQIPVWSATQTNREGLDTSIVSLKTISESLAKAMVADVVISIGRTPRLVENGRACYYLAKNRIGESKKTFEGGFNTSLLDLTVDMEGLSEDEYIEEEQKTRVNNAVRNVLKNGSKLENRDLDSIVKGIE